MAMSHLVDNLGLLSQLLAVPLLFFKVSPLINKPHSGPVLPCPAICLEIFSLLQGMMMNPYSHNLWWAEAGRSQVWAILGYMA